jgi:hypothetical protein
MREEEKEAAEFEQKEAEEKRKEKEKEEKERAEQQKQKDKEQARRMKRRQKKKTLGSIPEDVEKDDDGSDASDEEGVVVEEAPDEYDEQEELDAQPLSVRASRSLSGLPRSLANSVSSVRMSLGNLGNAISGKSEPLLPGAGSSRLGSRRASRSVNLLLEGQELTSGRQLSHPASVRNTTNTEVSFALRASHGSSALPSALPSGKLASRPDSLRNTMNTEVSFALSASHEPSVRGTLNSDYSFAISASRGSSVHQSMSADASLALLDEMGGIEAAPLRATTNTECSLALSDDDGGEGTDVHLHGSPAVDHGKVKDGSKLFKSRSGYVIER